MKKLNYSHCIVLLVCLSLVVSPFLSQVKADNAGTVTASVTAQNISVSVTPSSVNFGTIETNTTTDTTTNGVNSSVTATNDGNVTEKFNIKAQDSTSAGSGWTLGAAAGSETYTMGFCYTNCDTAPSWSGVGINPSYATLAASVASGGTQVFDLQVGTPTSTADYNQQSITITVQATTP